MFGHKKGAFTDASADRIGQMCIRDRSMRMIVYARKAKEIRDREKVEETTHWGKELVQEEKNPSITSSSK